MAQNQPIWVCEDDCVFLVERHVLDATIDAFMKSDAEVLNLGYNARKCIAYTGSLKRTLDCQTTSSYIAKPSIHNKLIDLWESVVLCRKTKSEHALYKQFKALPIRRYDFYTADQCWKVLQQDHIFVLPRKRYVIQRKSYSDIEKKITYYAK